VEWISYFLLSDLHLDTHLGEVIRNYDVWTYLILFVIIFCERAWLYSNFCGRFAAFCGRLACRQPGNSRRAKPLAAVSCCLVRRPSRGYGQLLDRRRLWATRVSARSGF